MMEEEASAIRAVPSDVSAESPVVPTRIAFCITDLDRGGAERALVQLVLHLDRKEWEPVVICLGPRGELADVLEAADLRVITLDARGLGSFPRVLLRLFRELSHLQPKIVQTFLFHANILGRCAARLAGIRCVVSGIRVAERRCRWHGWMDRATNGLVRMNVCVSRGVAAFSASVVGLDPRKLIVIPNAVDPIPFQDAQPADLTELGILPGHRILISIGRLEHQKGFDRLIDAIGLLDPLPDDIRFLIVGDGPESQSLRERVQRQGLRDKVVFAGRRRDIPQLLVRSLSLVLPSRWEGMPNVVLEAMAAGRPVVTTDVEGISELIRDGINGIVVPVDDVAGLKEGLQRLLALPPFLAQAGEISQAIVIKEFNTVSIAGRYADIYRSLLAHS